MKPKRRVMCPDCHRPKMLFETERKANDFIRWNADSMEYGSETLRAYYCPSCCGWHISHHEHQERYEQQTDRLIDAYHRRIKKHGATRIDKLLTNEGERTARRAAEIWKDLPVDIRLAQDKSRVKRLLTKYFEQNGIDDTAGQLRGEIYRLWRENGAKKYL